MSRKAKQNKPSKTRVVTYVFENTEEGFSFPFDVEKRLQKAAAAGTITNWDDGRNKSPWFEGPPGAPIRALRDEFVTAGGTLVPDQVWAASLQGVITANRWKMTGG